MTVLGLYDSGADAGGMRVVSIGVLPTSVVAMGGVRKGVLPTSVARGCESITGGDGLAACSLGVGVTSEGAFDCSVVGPIASSGGGTTGCGGSTWIGVTAVSSGCCADTNRKPLEKPKDALLVNVLLSSTLCVYFDQPSHSTSR